MSSLTYTLPKRINLKASTEYTEAWVQAKIAETPSILGLGDLTVIGKEIKQPRAGRFDLLLVDSESGKRYEVEVQLGPIDESHIIRTIEYWDLERKLYPQYEHCAVIVAEHITSRFLNVVSLFNSAIPLIAIQLYAFKVEQHLSLVFTTVLSETSRGRLEPDTTTPSANREYWLKKAAKNTVDAADSLESLVKEMDQTLKLNYTKGYIGLSNQHNIANNFLTIQPNKSGLVLSIRLEQIDSLEDRLSQSTLDTIGYDRTSNWYRIRLTPQDVNSYQDLLRTMIGQAWTEWND
ncbi:MAG: hypothetical protein NTX13_01750 [Acidobacteria bacterium]|nr:hypothetical protein [Acidobacteriota bacterium]